MGGWKTQKKEKKKSPQTNVNIPYEFSLTV